MCTRTGYRVGEEAVSFQQKVPVQPCYSSHPPTLMPERLLEGIIVDCPQGPVRSEEHLEFDLGSLGRDKPSK
jgi:hypothetical protein